MRSWRRLVLGAWPWLLAVLVLGPALRPGYVLTYDMVFVPDLAVRGDLFGLGSGLPRAVPSDAVVAVLDELVSGMVLQKLVLLGALVAAAAGAQRLAPAGSTWGALAASTCYVWSPYVAERLVIGHWPVLLAHAVLPWAVVHVGRVRAGRGGWGPLALLAVVGSLSASAGLMVAVVVLAFGAVRSPWRRTALLLGLLLAANAPWLVAGLLHGAAAVTDTGGVDAFAASAEGHLPLLPTLLGLGGIWNLDVVPASRLGALPVVGLVVTGLLVAAGTRPWLRRTPAREVAAYAGCAAVALLLALAGPALPGATAWLVSHVPGGGLVRDGSRYLGLLALTETALAASGVAHLAARVPGRLAARVLATGALLAPVAVLPDLALGVSHRLGPARFPGSYTALAAAVDRQGPPGDVLLLPFTAYRAPDWNAHRPVLDPLGRLLPRDYLAQDELRVSGVRVAGEDERARRVAALLARPDAGLLPGLAREGIGVVVLERDAPGVLGRTAMAGPLAARPVLFADDRLLAVTVPAAVPSRTRLPERLGLSVAWAAFVGIALGGAAWVTGAAIRSRRRPGPW